ncbi:SOS response-associated peptidase [Paenibacillus sp. IB182496]|uniref:Abasic site processing protein n=1 Tax=Paenibacillus sabuli TaxID=2772509 RepID=A0A927GSJ6_9BACL|nr:SOS response-associated peptidase [Paenibacillus sabuli]MBD2846090.1 SOS response-associated peptidase [Paenibacillus sabuli]
MCQRYSLIAESSELQRRFRMLNLPDAPKARYNISPTQDVPIVIGGPEERRIVEARWGLFPFWAKDSVNADYDSVSGKPVFERLVKRQRCLVPCSGFYGWKTEGKSSRAVRFVLPNQGVFALAGLYEERYDQHRRLHRTCTIMTTMANRLVAGYDTRMPVIMDETERESWLDPRMTDKRMLANHMYAYPASLMHAYAITPLARDEALETPEVIRELAPDLVLIKK